jgi:hypothetical protein
MIDLDKFFRQVRLSVFHGSLTKGQVDGMERIIDYWQTQWSKMPMDEFAYLLATVAHETEYKMQPVKEAGSDRYLRSKAYFPNVGVGLIQATWKRNWDRLGIKSVEDGLQWPSALHAAFYGMAAGIYTGKKLSDYIGHGKLDYVNARRIINGTDRAEDIAKIAGSFRKALLLSTVEVVPEPIPIPAPVPAPMPDAIVNYDQFKEWLLQALREDEEVRNAVAAIVYPDQADQATAYDPNDEPYEDYNGEDQQLAFADDELDPRYGQA